MTKQFVNRKMAWSDRRCQWSTANGLNSDFAGGTSIKSSSDFLGLEPGIRGMSREIMKGFGA